MTKVIINDEEFEANDGEGLLNIARRNGVHIGFACDGNGVCTTCECKVLEGAERLSKYNDVENAWLPASRKEAGYRLGCQATLIPGTKTLKVITRAELIKRQFLESVGLAKYSDTPSTLSDFVGNILQTTVDHVVNAPAAMANGLGRLGIITFLFPFKELNRFLGDTGLVVNKQLGSGSSAEGSNSAAPAEKDEQTGRIGFLRRGVPPAAQTEGKAPPTQPPPERPQPSNQSAPPAQPKAEGATQPNVPGKGNIQPLGKNRRDK